MHTNAFGARKSLSRNTDPEFLLLTPNVEKLLKELTYAIRVRQGLIVLTGEAGTGKTKVIHRLLQSLHQQGTPVAYVSDRHLQIEQLYRSMLVKFGAPLDSPPGSPRLALKQFLSERSLAGNTPVLIVDEAEALSLGVLEEIRMLLNLETPQDKMLTIVLVGRPLFEHMLRHPELYQLRQRIALRFKTAPFGAEETPQYIREHLLANRAIHDEDIFSPDAIAAIHSYSRGIPGMVNLLCEHSLGRAIAQNVRPVPAHFVAELARDLELGEVAVPKEIIGAEADKAAGTPSPIPNVPELTNPVPVQVSQAAEEPVAIHPPAPVPSLAHAVEPVLAECTTQASQPAHGESGVPLISEPLAALEIDETAGQFEPDTVALSSETVSDPPLQHNMQIPAIAPVLEPTAVAAGIEAGAGLAAGTEPNLSAGPARIGMRRWRRPHIVPVLSRWLRTPMDPLRAPRRWWSLFQALRLTAMNPAERARMRASLFRWLREPFDPISWLEQSLRSRVPSADSVLADRNTRAH